MTMCALRRIERTSVSEQPVLVVTTGGTIDKVYFDALSEFEVGQSVVGDLLRQAHVTAPFEIVEAMRKDSLELTDSDRDAVAALIRQRPHHSVVVTHGTDTMVQTGKVLADLVDRTIVLTGALSPARFAQTDAVFNVGMAFAAAQTLDPGVYIAMNGQVFDARKVRKDRDANRFVAVDEEGS